MKTHGMNTKGRRRFGSTGTRRQATRGALLVFLCVLLGAARVLAQTSALGTTMLVEGPAAGTDSVVLAVTPATQAWTATANDGWLHLDAGDQSGAGSANLGVIREMCT